MQSSKASRQPPPLPSNHRPSATDDFGKRFAIAAAVASILTVVALSTLLLVLLGLRGCSAQRRGDDALQASSGGAPADTDSHLDAAHDSSPGDGAGNQRSSGTTMESANDTSGVALPAEPQPAPSDGPHEGFSEPEREALEATPPPPEMVVVRPLNSGVPDQPDEPADAGDAGLPNVPDEFSHGPSTGSAEGIFRGALAGRSGAKKRSLLKKFGGTKQTDEAVQRALEWLKRNQKEDGSWSFSGPFTRGGIDYSGAATAMALLAFQGDGNTHKSGKYKKIVDAGWKALSGIQRFDGDFSSTNGYDQALPTIAICELYGMTKDRRYREPAQLAIDRAERIQDPQFGGWRYHPNGGSDTSVTGWFVMALQSGKMAELKVPDKMLERVASYFDQAAVGDGSQFGYLPSGGGGTLSMTAEGLLCRQYLGWKHDDPRLLVGSDLLARNPIDFSRPDIYYWYYATQVMHHMGGEYWERWNTVMREELPMRQVRDGSEDGSWEFVGGMGNGRLYTTCLCIYMLEVYYRHMPIYTKVY